MKKDFRLALLAFILCLASCRPSQNEAQKMSSVAQKFLESLYLCDFGNAAALATEEGTREVEWFASNLSEEDLALIDCRPSIKAGEVVMEDTVGTVAFQAENVLVADSLEGKGRIGSNQGTVRMVRRNGRWLVKALEW